jgi:hypothetical protein
VAVVNLLIASCSLPPKGGSHLSHIRGFRLQPEGCGRRESIDRLMQPSA